MGFKSRKTTSALLAALVALLAMACWAAETLEPTAAATAPPTSTGAPTKIPNSTNTPAPSTPAPTVTPTKPPRPTRTPRPTKPPQPTATPTSTPAPPPSSFRRVVPIDAAALGTVNGLRVSDGTLWLITDKVVARLTDTAWSVYLPAYTGKVAGIDVGGRIWVVNERGDGISAWDGAPFGNGGSWTSYDADAGWIPLTGVEHDVRGGHNDWLGRPWFATSEDVRVFDGERWIVITPQDMGMETISYYDFSPSFSVTVSESADQVWVSRCVWGAIGPAEGGSVRWFDGHTWHGADSPVASGCAPTIREDESGYIWVGTSNALWRYDPVSESWTALRPDLSTAFLILDTVGDPSGDMWVSLTLCGGSCFNTIDIYHVSIQDGTWTRVLECEGYNSPRVILDAAVTPWLFVEGRVYQIVDNVPELVTHLAASFVVMDTAGRVWFVAEHEGQDWLWTLDSDAQ
jgi:hypothetical protein